MHIFYYYYKKYFKSKTGIWGYDFIYSQKFVIEEKKNKLTLEQEKSKQVLKKNENAFKINKRKEKIVKMKKKLILNFIDSVDSRTKRPLDMN